MTDAEESDADTNSDVDSDDEQGKKANNEEEEVDGEWTVPEGALAKMNEDRSFSMKKFQKLSLAKQKEIVQILFSTAKSNRRYPLSCLFFCSVVS